VTRGTTDENKIYLSISSNSRSLGGCEPVAGAGGARCCGSSWTFVLFVKLHEFGEIELGLLENLDLSDHAVVLEWENFAAFFLNLFSNVLFN
jgi:hypothetical protein